MRPPATTDVAVDFTVTAAYIGRLRELVAADLEDAADYIERVGWVQGTIMDAQGRVCALGALQMTCSRHWMAAIDCLEQTIHTLDPDFTYLVGVDQLAPIAQWNDEPGRERQEVLDAFRAAAKHARGAT